jgi:hypothetical protein
VLLSPLFVVVCGGGGGVVCISDVFHDRMPSGCSIMCGTGWNRVC